MLASSRKRYHDHTAAGVDAAAIVREPHVQAESDADMADMAESDADMADMVDSRGHAAKKVNFNVYHPCQWRSE